MNTVAPTVGAGLAGAASLTLAHETLRSLYGVPRMDVVAERALRHGGLRLDERALHYTALGGDIVGNGLYYAAAQWMRRPRSAVLRGALAGAVAGAGALLLPQRLGLGRAPGTETRFGRWLTFGVYLLGGVVSGLVLRRYEVPAQ